LIICEFNILGVVHECAHVGDDEKNKRTLSLL
jgi:hypothetical protein